MTPEQIIIILPLPPRVLSPNCPSGTRGGRFARASAARRYKEIAQQAAEEAAAGMSWQRASVEAKFYHKTHRRRDDVNHLAMLKPAYDGVILSGLLPDDDRDHLRTVGASFLVDTKNPRVELVFTRE